MLLALAIYTILVLWTSILLTLAIYMIIVLGISIFLVLGIYEVHMISFQSFFIWAFKIVVDSWKCSMFLLYILWDVWPIFMISDSNQQLQQQLEYILLKPDYHS